MKGNAQTRVLVTGATGKIGRQLVDKLLARGYQVRALTSKPVTAVMVRDGLEWCRLDFQETLDFDSLVQECAAVIHLGAETRVIERMQRSNVEATRALAEASEHSDVKVFCYTSSVAVYGSSWRRSVREGSPVLSTDRDVRSEYWAEEGLRCYGRTKLQGEFAISAVAQNVEYVILRPTVVIGIPDLMKMRDWSKARKFATGSGHAHYVFIGDVVDAILWFIERSLGRDQPDAGVSTFNLSEDDAPIHTLSQIFRAAYETSDDPEWHTTTAPWPGQWLLMMVKHRRLLLRQPFGRMLFSADKLKDEGYTVRFGMSRAIAAFCEELSAIGTVKDGALVRSVHSPHAEASSAGGSNDR